jgi:tetratricopeptide (TPR) repeat protein
MKAMKYPRLAAQGDWLVGKQRYEEAVASYNLALAQEPHNGAVLYAKGACLLSLRTYEGNRDALRCFEAARDAGYETTLLWYQLSLVLTRLKRYSEALDASQRTVELDPSMAAAWNTVAHSLWRLGRDEEALAPADRALALDSTMVEAWFNKGMALFHIRRYEEALAAFERTTTLEPTDPWHWRMQAETLYSLRRYTQALAAFEQAIALDPNSSYLWRRKGDTLFRLWRIVEVFKVAAKLTDLQEEARRERDEAL